MLRSHGFWFFVLLSTCIVGPYALGVRPRTRRDWLFIALTIAFVSWMLLMAPLRS
jgi:hypothetical protein